MRCSPALTACTIWFVLLCLVSGDQQTPEGRARTSNNDIDLSIDAGLYPNFLQRNTDPSDISNFAGGCGAPGSSNPDMRTVFGGMFMDDGELDNLVRERRREMRRERKKSRKAYVKSTRLRKTIGRVSMVTELPTRGGQCCETRLEVTAPGVVMVDGKQMPVVHMNHSYQFVQEGVCEKPAARCRDVGICTQIYKYAFMLLYDRSLVNTVNPPVRFGQVQVKSHCDCMNIGRRNMGTSSLVLGNST